MPQMGVSSGAETRYYTKMNRASDFLLRCQDCKALVTRETIGKVGCCPGTPERACGTKRFAEITVLSDTEMASLTNGTIDFPYRAEFLAEFSPVEAA